MKYYGKIIGALIGWMLLRHPIGAVIGGLIGHAFDAGWLNLSSASGGGTGRNGGAHYKTLGLQPEASDAEVEQAYRRLIAQYHPDKVAGAADEIRALAGERASAINQAYEAIQRERRARRS
jgi:DnaJ-domain-containing protein 1